MEAIGLARLCHEPLGGIGPVWLGHDAPLGNRSRVFVLSGHVYVHVQSCLKEFLEELPSCCLRGDMASIDLFDKLL